MTEVYYSIRLYFCYVDSGNILTYDFTLMVKLAIGFLFRSYLQPFDFFPHVEIELPKKISLQGK